MLTYKRHKSTTRNKKKSTSIDILNRCQEKYSTEGPSVINYCVEQDIKARDALRTYSLEYEDIIARCEKKYSSQGLDLVKYCTDEDIQAQKKLDNY